MKPAASGRVARDAQLHQRTNRRRPAPTRPATLALSLWPAGGHVTGAGPAPADTAEVSGRAPVDGC